MAQTMDEFVSDMRRSVARWVEEAARFEAEGVTGFLPTIKSWIDAGKAVIALHDDHNA